MTSLDEAEYQRLQSAIGDAERIIGDNPKLNASATAPKIENHKQRVHTLEQEGLFGPSEQEKKNSSSAQALAVAAMVARESALSHEERQAYAGFLHKDYFTRNDIKALEEFYEDGAAYDRLSKKGKEEMAVRLLEGVQRGEISMDEVSPTIQRKQANQLQSMMTTSEEMHPRIAAIPQTQRDSFVSEYEAGNAKEAH
jgi:hypothetical protein